MAKYGCKYIRWAPIATSGTPEPEGKLPNYGTAISLSSMVKASDSPTFSEGSLYADNALAEYVNEFVEADIDLEVTEISSATAAALLGATVEDVTNDVHFSSEDAGPYGGLGFVSCKMVGGVKKFVGVFYPKVKAVLQGEDFETKGENVTFATGKLKVKATACKSSAWKVISEEKSSEAAAKTWVDTMFTTTRS